MGSISTLRAKIVCDKKIDWRGTPTAKFSWLKDDREWFMVDVWFESGNPQMQIRSSAHSLEEASVISQCIQMAIDWVSKQII